MSLIIFLFIGAIAGWLAGLLTRGSGFGLIGNILIGILGAFIGGHVFNYFGWFIQGLVGTLATATLGAVLLLLVVNLFKRG